jgi:NAD(P)-dependent dehydrogenase (short-subunit alcohol dehydrogenase family)
MATTPLKKIATPEDVANTIAFLASSKLSGHISGEIITV